MAGSVNQYKCDSCSWIYRSEDHAGVDLDDQPEGWTCPNCGADRDHFQIFVPPSDDVVEPESNDDELTGSLGSGDAIDVVARRVVFTRSSQPSVATLLNDYQSGDLDPQPDFQRYQVWTVQKNSRLIESLLMDLPIPIVYLSQEPDESTIVIDGQQRLMAIFDYLSNAYALKGLGPMKDQLEGKKFKALEKVLQNRLKKFQLTTVEILKESDPLLKFELFERLNMGATSLNDQELRNCVYRGSFNDFIREMAAIDGFRKKLLKADEPHRRMTDVELVLRFMAFWDQTYLKHPDKKVSQFLNDQMERGRTWKTANYSRARTAFKKATDTVFTVFGDKAFKRFVAGDATNPSGSWDRTNNRALMDVQLYGFTKYSKGAIAGRADTIRERSLELLSDPLFSDLIRHTTSESARVKARFEMWLAMLDEVMKDSEQGPRLFDRDLKETMFEIESNRTCSECGSKILSIDDAHLDHVLAYSKGGKTTPQNAKLLHRYCNIAKSSHEAMSDNEE